MKEGPGLGVLHLVWLRPGLRHLSGRMSLETSGYWASEAGTAWAGFMSQDWEAGDRMLFCSFPLMVPSRVERGLSRWVGWDHNCPQFPAGLPKDVEKIALM